MKPLIFNLFGHRSLVTSVARILDMTMGRFDMRNFPDKETYLKINEIVQGRDIIIMDSLDRPNQKILPLLLVVQTMREFGANQVGLMAPYLPYLRQDARFNAGEAITSRYFAELISDHFDWLLTVHPHLNRYQNLNEIYAIQAKVIESAIEMAHWIVENVENPLLIGLSGGIEQWIARIANNCDASYVLLKKIRRGDRMVEISMPDMSHYVDYTPVLIDDIISTGQTMIEAVNHLKKTKMSLPICLAVHAVFAEGAYRALQNTGVRQIVTCNTIKHSSNRIDLARAISEGVLGEARLNRSI